MSVERDDGIVGPMRVGEPLIRPEAPGDSAAIRAVLVSAFPTDAEARLVETLRESAKPFVSLVAEKDGVSIVGHILFTPVTIGTRRAMGLAPLSVRKDCQLTGIGSALGHAGMRACRALGELVVVVLGHPEFYPRFGFVPAWDHGLYHGEPGPRAPFMVAELEPGALAESRGEVRYHPAFDGL